MYEYWEQGAVVLHVLKDGSAWMEQLRIQTGADGEKYCCYGGRILSSHEHQRKLEPDKIVVARADAHAPRHDPSVLAAQRALALGIKADTLVDLGDAHDTRGLNPHILGQGLVQDLQGVDILRDIAAARYILKKREPWTKQYLLFGNHNRFATDFVRRNPQFAGLLDPMLMIDADVTLIPHLEKLVIGSAIFVHGDARLWGASGRLAEKLVRVYDPSPTGTILFGHVHYPAIRFGAYSVGMSGKLDQGYNEVQASTWLNGCAVVALYGGMAFTQLIDIRAGACCYGGRRYRGRSAEYVVPAVHARLEFDFE
jgi:hypothetical protein